MSVSAPHFLLMSEARRATADSSDAMRHTGGHSTGGCSTGGQWRFVLESVDGGERLEAADDEPAASVERLELLAVVRALESLDQPSRVTLVTRSRHIAHGLRFGLKTWRENNWKWERFGQLAPVKNDDLWRRVDQALQYHRVVCPTWRFDGPRDDCSDSRVWRFDRPAPVLSAAGARLASSPKRGVSWMLPLRSICRQLIDVVHGRRRGDVSAAA